MHNQVNFLWDDGFPPKVHLVVDSTYQLTIQDIKVEGMFDQGILRVTLVPDGEYYDCQEDKESFLLLLQRISEVVAGNMNWEEYSISWEFPLDPSWGEEEVETQLLARFCLFLETAGIPLTSDLRPVIEWQRGEF